MAYVPGAPASSVLRISAKARPIQSVPWSVPRFSKRSTASRSMPGASGRRAQAASQSRGKHIKNPVKTGWVRTACLNVKNFDL